MTTTSGGFGLRPVRHGQGGEVRTEGFQNGILSGYGTTIYQGDPVTISTGTGYLQIGVTTPGNYGVFSDVQWTDTNGLPQKATSWTSGTTGTDIRVNIWRDPSIIYEVQANGPVPNSALGDEADMLAVGAGAMGVATTQLSTTFAGVGSTKAFRIVNLGPGPYPGGVGNAYSNTWGDAYTIVQVMMSQVSGFGPGAAI